MFSPEIEILLSCMKQNLRDEMLTKLQTVDASTWKKVVAFAQNNAVLQAIYYRLDKLRITLPEDVSLQLKEAFLWNLARNVLINREINDLILDFRQEGIPVILLKGIYLSEMVYDNPGLRTMTDIDLLIPKNRVMEAIQISKKAGFCPDRPYIPDADGVLHYHAPPMIKDGLTIELHWSLTRRSILPKLDPEGLWERTQSVNWNGTETKALGLSDLILHLAVHAAYGHHFFHQLRSLYDLDRVIHRFHDEIDWKEIIKICREWMAEKGVYIALRLTDELLDSGIPQKVLEELRPIDWTEQAMDWARMQMFQMNPVLSESYIRLMQSQSLVEKIKALGLAFFPPRKVMAMEYAMPRDTWRAYLLYPRHIITRIQKYWGYAWRLLHGDTIQKVESTSDQSLRDYLGIGHNRKVDQENNQHHNN